MQHFSRIRMCQSCEPGMELHFMLQPYEHPPDRDRCMAVARPSAARQSSRVWRTNLRRSLHAKLILLLCPKAVIQTSMDPGKALCVYFDGKREGEASIFKRTQFLWAHKSTGPQKSAQFLLPTVPLATGYCRWSCGKHSRSTSCTQRKWACIPRRGNKLMIWGHGSLPTQRLSAVGHSRSQLGKSLTASFPRKSSE